MGSSRALGKCIPVFVKRRGDARRLVSRRPRDHRPAASLLAGCVVLGLSCPSVAPALAAAAAPVGIEADRRVLPRPATVLVGSKRTGAVMARGAIGLSVEMSSLASGEL